ncbi:hypothetical protein DDV96_05695 [Marixanthomonas spongiae]|uniref:Polysaccharide biosynthesis protein C-terminal domain-containing protein n=2 Tax=Marixanthomonas spongiae TaxID=2174845 RepID=A0A2U0I3R5_9FLAO|nr:hypothetical protein DDV96_05695 [Marixanthomonas spongiae]
MHIAVLSLFSLLLIPILLTHWDLELYGTWITIITIFNLIQVLEFGHASYVGNQFNQLVHQDTAAAKMVLGSAWRANVVMGIVQLTLVVLLYMSGVLAFFLDTHINTAHVAIVLGILFCYRMAIGSFRGIVVKTLNPFGLIYKSFQFAVIEKIVEFFILVYAAVANLSLIRLAMVWFLTKSCYSFLVLFQLKRLLPAYFPWWKSGSFQLGIINMKRSIPFAVSNFLDRLGNDGVVLLLSAFVGTSFLPLFVATRTLVNFGLKISDLLRTPLAPELINLYAKNKLKKITDVFKLYWFITGVALMGGFILSLWFIESLFEFWTRGNLSFNLALFNLLVVILLFQNYGRIITAFFMGINKTNVVLLTSVMRTILFFTVAFLFKGYGWYGIVFGMLFSELFVVSLWLPYHAYATLSVEKEQKPGFILPLFAILSVAGVLYVHYALPTFWAEMLLLIPIGALFYLQYKHIAPKTRNMVLKDVAKLLTFTSKPKGNAQ